MRFGIFHREESLSIDSLLLGAAAGAVGGLVGSWVMNQAHGPAGKLGQAGEQLIDGAREKLAPEGARQEEAAPSEQEDSSQSSDPAPVVLVEKVARKMVGRSLTPEEKPIAGSAVHYSFGATMGAVYGALAEAAPVVTAGGGTAYGAALWLLSDEAMVPALRLAPPPVQIPPSTHIDALATHLVYGLTVEGVRRLARRALSY